MNEETCIKSSPLGQAIEDMTWLELAWLLVKTMNKALPKIPDDGIIIGKND